MSYPSIHAWQKNWVTNSILSMRLIYDTNIKDIPKLSLLEVIVHECIVEFTVQMSSGYCNTYFCWMTYSFTIRGFYKSDSLKALKVIWGWHVALKVVFQSQCVTHSAETEKYLNWEQFYLAKDTLKWSFGTRAAARCISIQLSVCADVIQSYYIIIVCLVLGVFIWVTNMFKGILEGSFWYGRIYAYFCHVDRLSVILLYKVCLIDFILTWGNHVNLKSKPFLKQYHKKNIL